MSIESIPLEEAGYAAKKSGPVRVQTKVLAAKIRAVASDLELVHSAIASPEVQEVPSIRLSQILQKYQQSELLDCRDKINAELSSLVQEAKREVKRKQLSFRSETKQRRIGSKMSVASLNATIKVVEDLYQRIGIAPSVRTLDADVPAGAISKRGVARHRKGTKKATMLQKKMRQIPPALYALQHVSTNRPVEEGASPQVSSYEGSLGPSSSGKVDELYGPEQQARISPLPEMPPQAVLPLAGLHENLPVLLSGEELTPLQKVQTIVGYLEVVSNVAYSASMALALNPQDRFQMAALTIGGGANLFATRRPLEAAQWAVQGGYFAALAEIGWPIFQQIVRFQAAARAATEAGNAGAAIRYTGVAEEGIRRLQELMGRPLPAFVPALQPLLGVASDVFAAANYASMVGKIPTWDRYQATAATIGGVGGFYFNGPAGAAKGALYGGTYGGGAVRFVASPIRWVVNNLPIRRFLSERLAFWKNRPL